MLEQTRQFHLIVKHTFIISVHYLLLTQHLPSLRTPQEAWTRPLVQSGPGPGPWSRVDLVQAPGPQWTWSRVDLVQAPGPEWTWSRVDLVQAPGLSGVQ